MKETSNAWSGNNDTKPVDMMEDITSKMSKLKIPATISFGKKNPNVPQHRHTYNTRSKDVNMFEPTIEKKIHPFPRKRGPKKKKPSTAIDSMIE